MTPSLNASGPASEPAPLRPGRKLGPIASTVGSSHRAWLGPTREHYLLSGRTLADLSASVLAKSKLSELLRGVGHYPRWEVIHRLAEELNIPTWPLHRLWKQAAMDAGKSRDWVDRSTGGTLALTTQAGPPLEHGALRSIVEDGYRRYAGVFLTDDVLDAAVEESFAILWLSFDDALASPDIRRYAWNILSATVRAKADHRDQRPVLGSAAFDTVALLHAQTSLDDQVVQLAESLETFTAISKLPLTQLDVMVLRRLCGYTTEKVSDLLGIPLALVRSSQRHADRFLADTVEPPAPTGGTTS
ncbi:MULTISPECIES: sigma-70 family RNA polymerase sigma factor [unclassified Streptomyces]|uniref:sigma-70 family RNA polymerase sigma factor n=1 Tax=unclassified Streptomyces TaxID=2593676 RepID=UPI00093D2FCA|nr:sigma-70 family RNA polymerase sigma factor [Streptomyces sp. CB02058]OKI85899.1 RNA polymerase subunit sigma [Streptomyces sp. CB02058]